MITADVFSLNRVLSNRLFSFRMDCLIKTVRSEGYFGMYRGKTGPTGQPSSLYFLCVDFPLEQTFNKTLQMTSVVYSVCYGLNIMF